MATKQEKKIVKQVLTAWTDHEANEAMATGWEMWSSGVAVKDPVLPCLMRFFVLVKRA